MQTGYLELIIGPMFSGKTTTLQEIYEKNKNMLTGEPIKKIMVINYAKDIRYHETMLCTHDQKNIPCIQATNLKSVWENREDEADIILINEGQFFPDLFHVVLDMVEKHKKTVYVCGLDGDYQRQKFGSILDLVPYCDKIQKLSSTCECGKKAIFSHRIVNMKDQYLIGSSDFYAPLCRNCYTDKNT